MVKKRINLKAIKRGLSSDLQKAAEFIRTVDYNNYGIYQGLMDAANQIMTNHDDSHWGYSIYDMEIPICPSRHLQPNDSIKRLHLFVDIQVLAETAKWVECNDGDPLVDMNFKVRVIGDSIRPDNFFEFGFHIDHTREGDEPNEIHPLYHVHYFNNSLIGNPPLHSMTMDSPRLIHHPVEIILGYLLALANFNKDLFIKVKEEPFYSNLSREYSKRIIKPYFDCINNYWVENELVSKNSDICPYII